MRVLLLGADGFIGRHIGFHLRAQGIHVMAQARRPQPLSAMGFQTLRADLADPKTHAPAFWHPHLADTHLINAAGLLTGTEAQFRAVHHDAPKAALAALPSGQSALLISAVGITADTPFAHWRRQTESLFQNHTILRPGLVLADTSYGGSSALRAFAALPFVTPVVGDGTQLFNPIHAADLAGLVLSHLHTPGLYEVGGPETLSLADLTLLIRRWLGLPPQRILHIPLPLARALGQIGDALRLGPISATAVAQLTAGVLANPGNNVTVSPTADGTEGTVASPKTGPNSTNPVTGPTGNPPANPSGTPTFTEPPSRNIRSDSANAARGSMPVQSASLPAPSSATPETDLTATPSDTPQVRGVTAFTMARPAGTQDLWQARLYLLKPLIRLTLAAMWLWSGIMGLTLPPATFPMIHAPDAIAKLFGLADLALALALIRDYRPRWTAIAQLALVAGYTVGLTLLAPGLWLDPFGGLLKNLPVVALLLTHLALSEER